MLTTFTMSKEKKNEICHYAFGSHNSPRHFVFSFLFRAKIFPFCQFNHLYRCILYSVFVHMYYRLKHCRAYDEHSVQLITLPFTSTCALGCKFFFSFRFFSFLNTSVALTNTPNLSSTRMKRERKKNEDFHDTHSRTVF